MMKTDKIKEIIELPNRCGNENFLRYIPDTHYDYELVLDVNSQYLRISKEDDGNIAFVDPEGGPFICVGYKIDGMTLVKLSYDEDRKKFILTF